MAWTTTDDEQRRRQVKRSPLNVRGGIVTAGDGSPCQQRTLVLDACGVLVGEPTGPLFDAVAASAGKPRAVVAELFRDCFRDDLWSGRTPEAVFWNDFARACGLERPSAKWRRVIDTSMHPMPALRRLRRWSQSARLVLISNHRHEWLAPRLQALRVMGHFAELRISSLTGVVKPDRRAFAGALRDRATKAALYIDDKAANIAAARSLGVRSVLGDPKGLWIEEVEAWLSR